jgi:hypothetical protein
VALARMEWVDPDDVGGPDEGAVDGAPASGGAPDQ